MPTLWLPPLLLSTLFLVLYTQNADAQTDRTMRHFCSGTANEMQMPHGRDRFEDLRQIYQNCTRVFGNVEITHLSESDLNGRTVDFLDDIEEIKGYVMIYNTDLTRISFKKLKIIWGDSLIDDTASLYFEMNHNLSVISMPSLRTIEKGVVYISSTPRFCHLKNNVNPDEFPNFDRNRLKLSKTGDKSCTKNHTCHPSCNGACWGPGAEDCQTLYRSICPKNACESNQCFIDEETNQARCCHAQCLAGCTGPEAKDCVACSNFMQCMKKNEPTEQCECVEQCTSRRRYNNETDQMELNPDGYFPVNGRHCLKECPVNLLTQGDECVKECGPGMHYDPNQADRICRECDGLCPKTCRFAELLTSQNIAQLENCTEIEGHIRINGLTFQDQIVPAPTELDPSRTLVIRKLDPKELDVLKTVRFISHYVYIATADSPLRSLSFLENLEFIEGRGLYSGRQALVVSKNDNLEYLGLSSLKRIRRGDVIISSNYHLCHADNYNWKEIIAGKDNFARVAENKYDCSLIPSSSHL